MKTNYLLFCFICLFSMQSFAASNPQGLEPVIHQDFIVDNDLNWYNQIENTDKIDALPAEMPTFDLDKFLNLTPSQYEELTGKKLGFWNSIKLKAAQKYVAHELKASDDPEISKGIYILLAVLGLAWIAMGLFSDFSGSDWIWNLVLTLLCWLPGFIHALIKMKNYY